MSYKLLDSEQFHHMQATVETVLFDNGMTVKRLVSYDSVVCDVCPGCAAIFLYSRFQYSPTTIRQVTRFLDEYAPLENDTWHIGTIRQLQKGADSDGYAVLGKYAVTFLLCVLDTVLRW